MGQFWAQLDPDGWASGLPPRTPRLTRAGDSLGGLASEVALRTTEEAADRVATKLKTP